MFKNRIEKILKLLDTSSIRTIEVLIPYTNEKEAKAATKRIARNQRIQLLYIYNAPYNKSLQYDDLFTVLFYERNLTDIKHCGIIDEDYFMTDIKNISKSMLHNNCLKDKLFISQNGDIKNCPSMPQNFGNIKNTSLKDALSSAGFKKYQDFTKDHIEICKDCEFRYICTDCRAYTERTHIDKDGLDKSKPLKCGYDPYTGEWEEWSLSPLKQKAIKYYGMAGFFLI
ncbi:grasp-with-spasm system SPASM domain peptide maturase [Pedobacter lusitanus]|uniref:grasp-with-spasm system SPASM domain peptide maturase n=1 Tax=Pedobacter lusitanus TaxID=1503925 RepID=UPI0009E1D14F|nr:grasp-with-spasm system SPASM domain peptide maturase [Pedobacter lusitanus]